MRLPLTFIMTLSLVSSVMAKDRSFMIFGPGSNEKQMGEWISDQDPIQKEINEEIQQARDLAAVKQSIIGKQDKSDLHDALTDGPRPDLDLVKLHEGLAQDPNAKRHADVEKLPGMRPKPFENCQTLRTCSEVPMSVSLTNFETGAVEDAIASLIRPWVVLQKARGEPLRIIPAADKSGRLMKVSLAGVQEVVFDIYVSAQPSAINLSLKGSQDPLGFFENERKLYLASSR